MKLPSKEGNHQVRTHSCCPPSRCRLSHQLRRCRIRRLGNPGLPEHLLLPRSSQSLRFPKNWSSNLMQGIVHALLLANSAQSPGPPLHPQPQSPSLCSSQRLRAPSRSIPTEPWLLVRIPQREAGAREFVPPGTGRYPTVNCQLKIHPARRPRTPTPQPR